MKKFLTSTIVVALVATLMGVFAACGDDKSNAGSSDATIAKQAIAAVRSYYDGKSEVTDESYELNGTQKVGNKLYTVKWTVSSEFTGWADYIVVGAMNDDNKVPVTITKASEEIAYKLTATVTVGKASQSATFNRKVPAQAAMHAGTEADPYSAANVRELAMALDDNTFLMDGEVAKHVYVEGYVVDPGSNRQDNNGGPDYLGFIYIVDEYAESKDKNSDDAIMILSITYDDTIVTKASDLNKGDKIKVSGFIQKYVKNATTAAQAEVCRWKNPANNEYTPVMAVSLTPKPDERTEAQKVADALDDTADDMVKAYAQTGDVTLPAAPRGVTFSWAVQTETELVSIAENEGTYTMTIASVPQEAAPVVLTLTATSATDTTVSNSKNITITLGMPQLDHTGSSVDPLSVADVNKLFGTLGNNQTYQEGGANKQFYIKGYVTDVGAINGNYGLKNVYIADTAEKTAKSALVFNINWGEAMTKPNPVPSDSPLAEGDLVIVRGYLKNYEGTNEIAQGPDYPVITAWTKASDTTEPAAKVTAALAGVAATLSNIMAAGSVLLPVTKDASVSFTWEITEGGDVATYANGKLEVTERPEEDKTVTLKVTATCGTETDNKTVTVTVKAPELPDPDDGSTLKLTSESINKLVESGSATSYATYNGNHTVNGYTVASNQVMPGKPASYTDNTIQFQKSAGSLTLTGNFTKITIVVISTYDYSDTMYNVTITAGEQALTADYKSSANTGVMNGTYEYKKHTIEYTVTGGEQEIVIKNLANGAVYLGSIEFELAQSGEEE